MIKKFKKIKRKKLVASICVIVSVFILFYTIGSRLVNYDNDTIKTIENKNELGESLALDLEKIYNSENKDEDFAVIVTKDGENELKIDNTYIEYVKILDAKKENYENVAVENKILYMEAKNRKIVITDEQMEEIQKLSTSKELIALIKNEESKNKIQDDLYEYFIESEYISNLKNKISDEILRNDITINNIEIEQLLLEYNQMQKDFKEKISSTEEEKKDYFGKIMNKYYEIEELYYLCIKSNYNVIRY